MLKLDMGPSAPRVSQINVQPTVYLDHWALRILSERKDLCARFISAMKRLNGTWALSWLNLAEFYNVTNPAHFQAAENLVESIAPNLFFIELDPWKVKAYEDQVIQGQRDDSGWGDLDSLKAFVQQKKPSLNPLSAKGIFATAKGLTSGIDSLGETFVKKIEKMRGLLLADENFQKDVRKPPKGSRVCPPTRFLIVELIRPLVKDTARRLDKNDGIDFLHSVVPLSYCNYVLLDGAWATAAKNAWSRIALAGQVEPMAKVFSGGVTALENLIQELETLPDPKPTKTSA